jgi:phosphoribosylformylglycinamidine synthase
MAWQPQQAILLAGAFLPELGGSEYLARHHGISAGRPPLLDLDRESAVQKLVRAAIEAEVVRTAHDISFGGITVALAKMAVVSGSGAKVSLPEGDGGRGRLDAQWFGESASAIIIACDPADSDNLKDLAHGLGVPITYIGTSGGDQLIIEGFDPIPMASIVHAYEHGLRAPA